VQCKECPVCPVGDKPIIWVMSERQPKEQTHAKIHRTAFKQFYPFLQQPTEDVFGSGGPSSDATTSRIPPQAFQTTPTSPNLRASLLFLTNPNLIDDDDDEDQIPSRARQHPAIVRTTENNRLEEEIFNSVFQTQFDDNVVTRPRADPFLMRRPPTPRRPETPQTVIRQQAPRRLEHLSESCLADPIFPMTL
jgi:hypothetical protein